MAPPQNHPELSLTLAFEHQVTVSKTEAPQVTQNRHDAILHSPPPPHIPPLRLRLPCPSSLSRLNLSSRHHHTVSHSALPPSPPPLSHSYYPTLRTRTLTSGPPHSGFTGIPAQLANPANCVNIDLAGETRNDVLTGPCKPFTLIFARGTSENGNIGGIVGPPFVDALVAMLGAGNVAVQGVNNYLADVNGFNAGGSATGSQNAASVCRLLLCWEGVVIEAD